MIGNLKTKICSSFKGEFFLHTAIVFLGTIIVGFCGLLYHVFSVRLLSPEDYGTFNALISFIMFTSMTASPLATTFTRFFTEYIARKDFAALTVLIRKLIVRLLAAGFIILFLFIVLSSPLAGFFKTEALYIIICGGIIFFSLISLIFPSLFQSFQRFETYSFVSIVASLGKLAVGLVCMYLGWEITGGLFGFLTFPVLLLLVSLFLISGVLKKEMGHIDKDAAVMVNLVPIYKYALPVSAAMLAFTVLTNVDVIFIKHFFPPLEAGYYSIAQMVGKIALFLPSALAIVIIPKSTNAYVNNDCPLKFLYKALFLAGLCCLTMITISFLAPCLVLKILAGKVNPVSKGLVGLFSISMSFYSLSWIVINFFLAIHKLRFVLPLFLIAVLEIFLIYFYHPSLLIILWMVLMFSVITFISLLLHAVKK